MTNVVRYDTYVDWGYGDDAGEAKLEPSMDGDWVRYEDYVALLGRVAALELELRKQISVSKVVYDREIWESIKRGEAADGQPKV